MGSLSDGECFKMAEMARERSVSSRRQYVRTAGVRIGRSMDSGRTAEALRNVSRSRTWKQVRCASIFRRNARTFRESRLLASRFLDSRKFFVYL
eukprot:scaffold23365_cov115-Isochrysis_galbana.AAC.10